MSNKGPGLGIWFAIGILFLICAGAMIFLGQGGDAKDIELLEHQNLQSSLSSGPLVPQTVSIDPAEVYKIVPIEQGDASSPGGGETTQPGNADQDYLDSVVYRWVYIGFIEVGPTKQGSFIYNTDNDVSFTLAEGASRDGVNLFYIDRSKARVKYRSAVAELPVVGDLRVSKRAIANPVFSDFDSSPEAIEKAKRLYYELYGKRFEFEGRKYTPKPGEMMPPKSTPSKEELEAGVEKYLDDIADRMASRKNQDGAKFNKDEFRDELHKKYRIGKYADQDNSAAKEEVKNASSEVRTNG